MRLSVLIPSFNQGAYLAETLATVARQDYKPLEVIVMDGGSIDETARVVEAYGDLVTTFVSEKDRGQIDAIEKAAKIAKGDTFYWLNSDDAVMPGAFAEVARLLAQNPKTDVVYSDDYVFMDEGERLFTGSTISNLTFDDFFLFYRQFYSECVYWRASLTAKALPVDTSLRVATDYSFFLPIVHGATLRWSAKRLGAFRQQPNQMSQKFKDRVASEQATIKAKMRERLGLSEADFAARQAKHRRSFDLRHRLYPKAHSALRFLGRKLSGDVLRKRVARHFFNEWLVPPPEVMKKLEGVVTLPTKRA